MNHLVKIIIDEDGETIDDPVWHLSTDLFGGGAAAFCSGEFYGIGESDVVFESKRVKRGGITCSRCLDNIKTIKAVKL